jgi:hypothetical protein
MRIAACVVVTVLGTSLHAAAQPPAHASGKTQAYGHARTQFAVDDFKVGLASSPKAADKKPSPRVEAEPPRPSQLLVSPSPVPDCFLR